MVFQQGIQHIVGSLLKRHRLIDRQERSHCAVQQGNHSLWHVRYYCLYCIQVNIVNAKRKALGKRIEHNRTKAKRDI
jgi:hypothetical protein